MHKDLSDQLRATIENSASRLAITLHKLETPSLAITREAWINAFDKAAEELDAPI